MRHGSNCNSAQRANTAHIRTVPFPVPRERERVSSRTYGHCTRLVSRKSERFRNFRHALLTLVVGLSACATDPAPHFRGRWQDVNRLADAPVAIPLHQSYVYSVSPMDRTLKGLLTRWAQCSQRTVSYLSPNDYTLYAPVQQISATKLEQAVAQLNNRQ